MKLSIYPFIALILTGGMLFGQNANNPNAFAIKKTFIDYHTPIEGSLPPLDDLTGGWELAYHRHISGPLTAGVPVKMGFFRPKESLNNITTLSLDLVARLQFFKPEAFFKPYLFGGFGFVTEDFDLGGAYYQTPAGIGLNFRLAPNAYFNIQSEYRYSFEENKDNLQHGIGLWFILGKASSSDLENEAITKNDQDGDGIADAMDDCPEEAGPKMLKGCPDLDGDGVADHEDKCPEHAGLPIVGGCPDEDRDGISDFDDECPETYGKLNGCPDADNDGIADSKDPCPNVAGTNGEGCPGGKRPNVVPADSYETLTSKGETWIAEEDKEILNIALKNVQFELERARLKSYSLPYLDRVAKVMEKYPEYKLRIIGHTDSTGDATFNLKLSRERAKACFRYLVSKGIQEARIAYLGVGEARPIATNKYESGRKLNRRVEFQLVQ